MQIWVNRETVARHIDRINQSTHSNIRNDHMKDSERLCILISMTVWAIWKSRNKITINNQDVAPGEATSTLKELI